jgi:hypothetical protein
VGCQGDSATSDAADTEPPRVVATHPRDGERWPAEAPVTVTFNEAVTEDSATAGVGVIGVSGQAVYEAPIRTVSFTPSRRLSVGSSYTLTVSRVVDLAGNRMAGVVSVNFTAE